MFDALKQVLHCVLGLPAARAQWRFGSADNVEVAVERRPEASIRSCARVVLCRLDIPFSAASSTAGAAEPRTRLGFFASIASSTARVWIDFLVFSMSGMRTFISWYVSGAWKLVGMRCCPPLYTPSSRQIIFGAFSSSPWVWSPR